MRPGSKRSYVLLAAWISILLLPACTKIKVQVKAYQPNIVYGGRAVAIAVQPGNPNHILVASDSGGLFASLNGGKNWNHEDFVPSSTPYPSTLRSFVLSDVAFSPDNPNIVIATAFIDFRTDVRPIWRSANGGQTWTWPTTALPPGGPRCTDRPSAYSVSFEPGSSNVYVATDCGLATSNDLGGTWNHVVLDNTVTPNLEKTQDRVWSVLAQAGGRINVAADDGLWYTTNGGAHWDRSQSLNAGKAGVSHAFAASPFSPTHLLHLNESTDSRQAGAVYMSSNGGASWTYWRSLERSPGRPLFVRSAKSVAVSWPSVFDAYIGDGTKLYRSSWASTPPGTPDCPGGLLPCGETFLPVPNTWIELTTKHDDPSDIAFATTGVPILLAGDGGLQVTSNNGLTWTFPAGGTDGFNALQLFDVTGQVVSGNKPHHDLYIGTMDNMLWASPDDGKTWPASIIWEGFFVSTMPTSVDHANTQVTYTACWPCSNGISDANFAGPKGWVNPTNSVGPPFLLKPGYYIQAATDKSAPTSTVFRLTRDSSKSWDPTPAFTIPLEQAIGNQLHIAGPQSNPTIYVEVRRPGATVDGAQRVGLVRVRNLYSPGAVEIRDADQNGAISLGYYSSQYPWGAVVGVNPSDPDELLAADVQNHGMRHSFDGGLTWIIGPDDPTTLATANGFLFQLNYGVAMPVVRQIAFDPLRPCQIVIGTRGNGIIHTDNDGVNWSKLLFSEWLGDISSFYFPATTQYPVYVSSYGRGLWQLFLDRTTPCPPPQVAPVEPGEGYVVYHDLTQKTDTRYEGLEKALCEDCRQLLVKDGQITDLEFEGSTLRRVIISGGSVHEFDARGQSIVLDIPNAYRGGLGKFGKNEAILAIAKKVPIRGLVLQQARLVGVITSASELPRIPGRSPYLRLISDQPGSITGVVEPGGQLSLVGEGFLTGPSGSSGLEVRLAGQLISRNPAVDDNGCFRIGFAAPWSPGTYDVAVEQQVGLHMLRDTVIFNVVVRDETSRPR